VVVPTPGAVTVEVVWPTSAVTLGRLVVAVDGFVVVVGRRAVVTVVATALSVPAKPAGGVVVPVVVAVTVVVTLAAIGVARTSVVGGVEAAACAAKTPPAVNAAAPTATWAPVARACPAIPRRATNGTSATHETGPITQRSLPIETLRKALTIAGSNWLPAQRVNSVRATTGLIAFLYERTAVITSKASATETMRAPSEISSPDRPNGYPDPSWFSWCCSIARLHAPSHGARGATNRRPSRG